MRGVNRHLQIAEQKPCASKLLDGQIWPQPGQRATCFYALAQELRRAGKEEQETLAELEHLYKLMPEKIRKSSGGDGKAFAKSEVVAAVKSAYRTPEPRPFGCNNALWKGACVEKSNCRFYQKLGGESRGELAGLPKCFQVFIAHWLSARNSNRKILADGVVRTYLGILALLVDRGFTPGSILYVSHQNLAEVSGLSRPTISEALNRLASLGLISYSKGNPQQRGTASEIQITVPAPLPAEEGEH